MRWKDLLYMIFYTVKIKSTLQSMLVTVLQFDVDLI